MESKNIQIGQQVKVYGWKSAAFAIFTGKVVKVTENMVWVERGTRTFAGSPATVEVI
jgi:RNase P/RNase MRP subunit p29